MFGRSGGAGALDSNVIVNSMGTSPGSVLEIGASAATDAIAVEGRAGQGDPVTLLSARGVGEVQGVALPPRLRAMPAASIERRASSARNSLMNVDQALQEFRAGGDLPTYAMRWARDHWDQAAPRFIARLRAVAAGRDRSEAAEDEVFFILHLCGEKRETRAYEPLCRMIADEPDIEEWLGDATQKTLPGILINVFDGDASPLTRAIESADGDEFARASALTALGYLVRMKNVLPDADMRAYLRRLRRTAQPREESIVWIAWGQTASALGYEDLRVDMAMLTKDELVDPCYFSLEDFDKTAALAREDAEGLAGFHAEQIRPLDDAIGTLESWSRAGEDGEEQRSDEEDCPEDTGPGAPYVNPFRDVGRNDPCPCGSGKKYKKCCIGEESLGTAEG